MVLDSEFIGLGMLLLADKNEILEGHNAVMRKYCLFLIFVLVGVSVACAGDWPHWRGPYFNGSTDEKNLPSKWSTSDNIAWSVDLAGSSAATPIISGDRVFLSGVDTARDMLLAMCFDRTSGELHAGYNTDRYLVCKETTSGQ